jgi:predicted tellurium resistance membrane protein TerC
MFGWIASPEAWTALAALTAMEIVLGIDNVVFISVLVSRLPPEQGERARRLGILLALGFRLALLFTLTAILKLTQPVIFAFGASVSWRDIILLVGGLFLIVKATHEMHLEMEGGEHLTGGGRKPRSFLAAMVQIAVIDLVFSVDSILTAIGMSRDLPVMVIAVLISMVVMYVSAGPVASFIRRHPTTKMLALAFLLLIGVMLVMEAFHRDIDRTLIYAAMAFAVFVEVINLRAAKGRIKARRRKSVPPPAAVRSGPAGGAGDKARHD